MAKFCVLASCEQLYKVDGCLLGAGTGMRPAQSVLHLAGTVLKLGTQQHHDQLLSVIDSLDATGCFGLTELGFGECLMLLQARARRLRFSQGRDMLCCAVATNMCVAGRLGMQKPPPMQGSNV